MIIAMPKTNAMVAMTRTATSQRRLVGSKRGIGADIGEEKRLPVRLVVAGSPPSSVVRVASEAEACTVVFPGTDAFASRGAPRRLRSVSFIGMALQEEGHRTLSFLLTRSALAGYGLDMRVSNPSFESSCCRLSPSSIGTRQWD